MLEVYCDASYYFSSRSTIIAFVIKENGRFIHIEKQKLNAKGSNIAETKAIISALDYLLDNKLKTDKIIIYNDNEGLISQINNINKPKNMRRKLTKSIYDKCQLLNSIYDCSIQWTNRKNNRNAHLLTHDAKQFYEENIIDIEPVCIGF